MSERATRLAERLPELGADLLVVTSLVNVRYLTGFTGSNGMVLVGPDTRAFVTDFRYVEQSAAEVDAAFDRTISPELLDTLPDLLPAGELRLAFEDAHMSVRTHARLGEIVTGRAELVAAGDAVEALRAIKDADEVHRIAEAAKLADAALRQIMEQGLAGRTEIEVAVALERAMEDLGAKRPSFDSIVAAGPHGALPHAQPRDVQIGRGELVVVDWGAVLDGYCSDCTRTLATGDLPDATLEVYDLVREAELAGLEAVRAGTGGREADAAAREVIAAAGHGDHFGHGLGHGVGLDIHEAPRLSQRSDSVLADGNVVTVEPGVYLPGEFGVRIEDLVVVTEGAPQILTSVPKELITVG
ncbi:MAG TPA: Xaa-Pro peptidase family protein [Solirubrobacteraceae bacterium]|nr:Xaa-Pro peptidase family protein [Solirubrobacteraceae bacterium]